MYNHLLPSPILKVIVCFVVDLEELNSNCSKGKDCSRTQPNLISRRTLHRDTGFENSRTWGIWDLDRCKALISVVPSRTTTDKTYRIWPSLLISRAFIKRAVIKRAFISRAFISRAFIKRAVIKRAFISRAFINRVFIGRILIRRVLLSNALLSPMLPKQISTKWAIGPENHGPAHMLVLSSITVCWRDDSPYSEIGHLERNEKTIITIRW
jgi:hypothetical protein